MKRRGVILLGVVFVGAVLTTSAVAWVSHAITEAIEDAWRSVQ